MADLGDLSGFLKDAGVSDLDWLDVDEEEYRSLDKLPQQNLDIAPDLQAAWSHEDKPANTFLPNTGDAPRTMGDLSQAHGKLASDTRDSISKVVRFSLMKSSSLTHLRSELTKRFDLDALRLAKDVIKEAYEERGLIGKLYVNAEDFPDADNPKSASSQFLRKYASSARYVVVKPGAKNCVRAFKSPTGADVCSVFHKEIVLEVPYTDQLANQIERAQLARGKSIQASTSSPKERIRQAYLAEDLKVASVETPKPIVDPLRFMQPTVAPKKVHLKVVASTQDEVYNDAAMQVMAGQMTPEQADKSFNKAAFDKKARDVLAFLRREMLRGRGEKELIRSMKIAFSVEDLKATKPVWEPLFREAGLYGTVYSTQDSFDECREGADFLAKHNPSIKGVVAGSKCDGCIYNKMSRCMMYGKPLVKEGSDLMTDDMVKTVVREYRTAGKLEHGAEKVVWGSEPKEALKAIYRVASTTNLGTSTRIDVYTVFSGKGSPHNASALTRREIIKTASRYLNEGLYGSDLLEALKRQYDPRDLVAAKKELRPILAEQGLQGIYYVDPTVYNDYGKGCSEAERLHRSRLVPYVKAASACGSCVHHTRPGWCSKLSKSLVDEIPYVDKQAQQREILASGKSTQMDYTSLVNNGASMIDEFQVQSSMDIDLNPEPEAKISVEVVGGQKVKV